MGTIQVNSILSSAATLTQDVGNIRWPVEEGLQWLNDGQREMTLLKPKVSVKNIPVKLKTGTTKQDLPADGFILIDITRNMGADGTTAGRVIQPIAGDVLDNQAPDWHSEKNLSGEVKHFIFDPRNPKNYYVYPQAPDGWVELIYSVAPTDCVAGGTIQVDDIYANALLDYVLFRCYSKDVEFAGAAQLAATYYQSFAK